MSYNDDTVTIEEEINQNAITRPHVVILGAGASRATCVKGDRNKKLLPLMKDFVEVVGLKHLLAVWDYTRNFEEIFSDLFEQKDYEKIERIRTIIHQYFSQLELPEQPTVYDHLVLSLQSKDLIATFNWDPLLVQAYLRNQKSGLSLPRLVFLHGNVLIGYCEKDMIAGIIGEVCSKCKKPYIPTPLLYPIKKKNYTENAFIAGQWKSLKMGFKNAFMITIFGYSAPTTDTEAIKMMKEGWGDKYQRSMEQTAFITPQTEDEICETWKPLIHSHHYDKPSATFYDSRLANHPRRTGESWFNQFIEAKFFDDNPIPKDLDFPKLWEWFERFKDAERR